MNIEKFDSTIFYKSRSLILSDKNYGKIRVKYSDVLGQGTFGQVYRGLDEKKNIEYAVKFIKYSDDFNDVSLLNLIDIEKQIFILSQLPNDYFKFCVIDKKKKMVFIVSELYQSDIRTFMKNPLDFKKNLNIIYFLLLEIKKFHKNNIIHKDIKPENIMLDKFEIPHFIDFDFSCIADCKDPIYRCDVLSGGGTEYYENADRILHYHNPSFKIDDKLNKEYLKKEDLYALSICFIELFKFKMYPIVSIPGMTLDQYYVSRKNKKLFCHLHESSYEKSDPDNKKYIQYVFRFLRKLTKIFIDNKFESLDYLYDVEIPKVCEAITKILKSENEI